MPILAVTLGDEGGAETTHAAVATAAAGFRLPMVSEAMREDVMHLFWANFEVSMICCYSEALTIPITTNTLHASHSAGPAAVRCSSHLRKDMWCHRC